MKFRWQSGKAKCHKVSELDNAMADVKLVCAEASFSLLPILIVQWASDLSAHRLWVVARSWEWVINDGTIPTYVIPTRQLHKSWDDQWPMSATYREEDATVMTSTSIMLSGVTAPHSRLLSTIPFIIDHYNELSGYVQIVFTGSCIIISMSGLRIILIRLLGKTVINQWRKLAT